MGSYFQTYTHTLKYTTHIYVAASVLQSLCGLWMKMRTNAHRLQKSCGEKLMVWYSLKMRVLQLLLSRGEHLLLFLDRLLLFLSGLIISYIECCCLQFRNNQRNKNNKCRRERWWADYALSLEKFIQALEITLKMGNKHLLFQTRVRIFSKSRPEQSGGIFQSWFPQENQSEGLVLPTTSLLSTFWCRAESHSPFSNGPVPYTCIQQIFWIYKELLLINKKDR